MLTSDTDQQYLRTLRSALIRFERERVEALARRAVYRLQRIHASGIFGEDYRYRSLWDEYCHEVQHGLHDTLDWAWASVIDPVVAEVTSVPSPAEAQLLSLALDDDETSDTLTADTLNTDRSALREAVAREINRLACHRNLGRFAP